MLTMMMMEMKKFEPTFAFNFLSVSALCTAYDDDENSHNFCAMQKEQNYREKTLIIF